VGKNANDIMALRLFDHIIEFKRRTFSLLRGPKYTLAPSPPLMMTYDLT